MNNSLLNNLSHNAYCIIGSDPEGERLVLILEKDHGITKMRNQDFFYSKFENFTIDDARALKTAHEMMPVVEGGKKVFIIIADNINTEAQNALLKLLEEPATYAHFFIIIPGAHLLLPTVKSRLCFIEISGVTVPLTDFSSEIRSFLKSNTAKKLEFVKKFVDDISKEKKTKQDAIIFLKALEVEIRKEKGVKNGYDALNAIEEALKYMNDRSPSVKMILDYVALNV